MPNIFADAVEVISTHLFSENPRFDHAALIAHDQPILDARPAVGDLGERVRCRALSGL
jgi:hypothetical protein